MSNNYEIVDNFKKVNLVIKLTTGNYYYSNLNLCTENDLIYY